MSLRPVSCSPVFIVGCPRSGTTLLQVKLSTLEHLAIPPEDDFILRFYHAVKGDIHKPLTKEMITQLLNDLFEYDGGTFRHWQVTRDAIEQKIQAHQGEIDIRVLIDLIYQAFLSRFEGKTRWGCKVPYFAAHVGVLAKIFPEAKFIHIIRDGRAVYQSMLDRIAKGAKHFPVSAWRAGWLWRKYVSNADSQGRTLGNSFIPLRYEALVEDDNAEMAKLESFLGELRTNNDFYGQLKENQLIRTDNIELYVKPKVDKSDTERWQQSLTPRQVYLVEAMAKSEFNRLNYPLTHPDVNLSNRLLAMALKMLSDIYDYVWVPIKRLIQSS